MDSTPPAVTVAPVTGESGWRGERQVLAVLPGRKRQH